MTTTRKINVQNRFDIGGNNRFVLIAGPCAIESEEMTMQVATELKQICLDLGIHLIFKSSFDKANRSSVKAPRGLGMERGLQILQRVKTELQLPIVTDVHESWQCAPVAEVADMLQIPAFLSRQTDLLFAAGKSGVAVNVKKGQFLAPNDMKNVVRKLEEAGCENILLTERGFSLGYNNLVVDMRALPIMRSFGYPVVFDATHSVQLPGGAGTASAGQREYVGHLARAAAAVGVDALFLEVHDNPEEALCDGPNMVYLDQLEELLLDIQAIDGIARKHK